MSDKLKEKEEMNEKNRILESYSRSDIDIAADLIVKYEVSSSYIDTTWNKGVLLIFEMEKLGLKLIKA